MARNLDAKCRQCRREGEKLFLKGEKCFTDKCSVERRAYAPGQHGEARQVVRHNGVLVNGKKVDIPSFCCRPGDVIQLLDKTRQQLRTKAALEAAQSRGFPEWLEVDIKDGRGVFKSYPARQDLPASISEGLVVELYSR